MSKTKPFNWEKELKKVKLAKLPKGHKRVKIDEKNFVDVLGCLEAFCKLNKFKVESIEVQNVRLSSYRPEELASVTIKGIVEINGESFNAEVCGDEMIVGDKLPDLANYLTKTVRVVI